MKSKTESNDTRTNPLDESWWEQEKANESSPHEVPILAPYEQTQPGFEAVVAEALKGRQDTDCFPIGKDGCQRICLWDIWEKQKDPAETDAWKQKINDMQRKLGDLSDDDRYIRIQIACLERCFWTFPANVDLILDGIAASKVNLNRGVSCEPPWAAIREVLLQRQTPSRDVINPAVACLHHQQGIDPSEDNRQKLIRTYAKVLRWWSTEGSLDHQKAELPADADLAERVYRWLGEPNKLKWLYVQKLCSGLNFWALPGLPRPGRWERRLEFEKSLDEKILDELSGQEDKLGRLIERNNDNGSCHHAFFRHIDHIIAHIGKGEHVKLPDTGKERKRIHTLVTNYVHALGSWLVGRTIQQAVSIWPPSKDTMEMVCRVLGEATPRKRWLVACLWKKLQENQAHHGCGALDEEPERFALSADTLKG